MRVIPRVSPINATGKNAIQSKLIFPRQLFTKNLNVLREVDSQGRQTEIKMNG